MANRYKKLISVRKGQKEGVLSEKGKFEPKMRPKHPKRAVKGSKKRGEKVRKKTTDHIKIPQKRQKWGKKLMAPP